MKEDGEHTVPPRFCLQMPADPTARPLVYLPPYFAVSNSVSLQGATYGKVADVAYEDERCCTPCVTMCHWQCGICILSISTAEKIQPGLRQEADACNYHWASG